MMPLKWILASAARLWLTGILLIFLLIGYIFYSMVWIVRLLQRGGIASAAGAFIAILLLGGGGVYYVFFPLHRPHSTVTIVIPKGCCVRGIADSLYRHQIITSRCALRAWLALTRADRTIQAGKFSFVTSGGIIAAVDALRRPEPLDTTVIIPEGLTIEQTAACIRKALPIDTLEFITLCYDSAFTRNTVGIGVPSLEGYLFPDTYKFQETTLPSEIIRRMVALFFKRYEMLGVSSDGTEGMTRHEIVTLASIVEKEAVHAPERPRIAGVFHNRLRLGYPLGADPTVRYIFKKFSGPLYVSELNCNSPYNTRKVSGLPPGPICSPGLGSLQAAASPMKTNELYFVARWDGSGLHDFSVTNHEHSRKKNKIRRYNETRLREKAKKRLHGTSGKK